MKAQIVAETETKWYHGKHHEVESIDEVRAAMDSVLQDANVQTDMFTLELEDGSYSAIPLIRILDITAQEVV